MQFLPIPSIIAALIIGASVFVYWNKDDTLPNGMDTEMNSASETDVSASASETVSGNKIDLSGKGLKKTPDYVFTRTGIEVLDLSHNQLDGALQAEVRHLQNLRVLDLSDNGFTGVPAEVGQLAHLEVLDLSNNPITGLPHEIGNLKNLKLLDLRGTNYSTQDLEVIKEGFSAGVEIRTE